MTVTMETRVVSNEFSAIAQRLNDMVPLVVAKAALDIEAQAKVRAAVDTGYMKNSIQATQIAEDYWRVTVGATYGVYVEYGTVHSPAQPFIRPAVEAVRPQFLAAIRKVMNG